MGLLLRCTASHNRADGSPLYLAGNYYYFEGASEELGRRLLQDFGKGSRHEARHQETRFAKVAMEGDTATSIVDGEEVSHAVTRDEAYNGDVYLVTTEGISEEPVPLEQLRPGPDGEEPELSADDVPMGDEAPGGGGAHLSQSEPPTQPPYPGDGPTLGEKAESPPTGPQGSTAGAPEVTREGDIELAQGQTPAPVPATPTPEQVNDQHND